MTLAIIILSICFIAFSVTNWQRIKSAERCIELEKQIIHDEITKIDHLGEELKHRDKAIVGCLREVARELEKCREEQEGIGNGDS